MAYCVHLSLFCVIITGLENWDKFYSQTKLCSFEMLGTPLTRNLSDVQTIGNLQDFSGLPSSQWSGKNKIQSHVSYLVFCYSLSGEASDLAEGMFSKQPSYHKLMVEKQILVRVPFAT